MSSVVETSNDSRATKGMSPLRFTPVDMTVFLTLLLREGGVPKGGGGRFLMRVQRFFVTYHPVI